MITEEDRQDFGLICPHCGKKKSYDEHPDKYAINSKEEFNQILESLKNAISQEKAGNYQHNKVFHCQNSRWICPQSSEAIICKSKADTIEFLKELSDWCWLIPRAFRLYKGDFKAHWENYFGIVFNLLPVPRQKNIELEQIIDTRMLSRLILGIGVEIEGPLTVYSANIFADSPDPPWMPVEGYSKEGKLLVPPHYNEFCRQCREIVMGKLIQEFKTKEIGINNCSEFSKNGLCAGKEPACVKKDWNHCPVFLKRRKESCPCYVSDIDAIEKVKKGWRDDREETRKGIPYRCKANFQEIAFPIEVHDHLIGVALSGQVFHKKDETTDVNKFVENWNLLQGHKEELTKALKKESEPKRENEPRFFINEDSFKERIARLERNCRLISDNANSIYRGSRSGLEMAFRSELLGFIQNHKRDFDFFTNSVPHILKRMRAFWAFKATYLMKYSLERKSISFVAFGHQEKDVNLPNLPDTIKDFSGVEHIDPHPTPLLYRRGEYGKYRHSPFIYHLLTLFEAAIKDPASKIPEGEYYFFTIVPASKEVYIFIFAVRDQQNVSNLECPNPGSVSKLCQDAILETCTQVIHEFVDIRLHKEREQNWREFSALSAHRLGNEINSIHMLIVVLADAISKDPLWLEKWGETLDVIKGCTKRFKRMLTLLSNLSAQIKPALVLTDLTALIKRSAMGILPDMSALVFKESHLEKQIMVDSNLMEQVFRELYVNAVRAGGASIHITVTASEGDNMLDISFCDDGPGILQEDVKKIFEPFTTFSRGTTGLGLTIVKRIIEAHDGTIRIGESKQGAKFIISLPLIRSA